MDLAGTALMLSAGYYWLLMLDSVFVRTADNLSGYLDEIVVLFAMPLALAALFRPPPGLLVVPISFGIYLASGIVSGLFSPIGGYPFAMVTGLTMALDSKPIILAIAFAYCLARARDSDIMLPLLYSLVTIALLNLPFVLRDLVLNSGTSIYGEPMDSRGGIYRPQGLFHHTVSSVDVHLLATMAAAAIWGIRKNATWAGLTLFLALITMLHIVAKEIVAVVLVLALTVLTMQFRQRNTQILVRAAALTSSLLLAIPFADLVLPIIQGQVTAYVEDGESAIRTLMYLNSVKLAADNFPLGTGLGTFGSLASYTIFYSPIYDQTGLSLIYGASRLHPHYIQDVFWPKVLGESGWLGLFAYLGLLLFLAGRTLRSTLRRPTVETLFACFVLVTALVKSIAAATMTSDFYVMILGVAIAIAACHPNGFGQTATRPGTAAGRRPARMTRPLRQGTRR
ncbi:MAG: hypothetical protein RIB84_05410 [Sneathiellaceae bacterium]